MPQLRDDVSFWKGLCAGLAVAAIGCGMLALRDGPSLLPAANAQFPAVAGGGGVYLMPGQLETNVWGVYLLDTDQGTLVAYRYDAGSDRLQLLAARDIGPDRGLAAFNTFPPPEEVRRLVDIERQRQDASN